METQEANRSRLKKILEALRQKHPDARLALDFSNPLELLIARSWPPRRATSW